MTSYVRDGAEIYRRSFAIIRAEALSVPWSTARGAPGARFGTADLEVGPEPSREREEIEPAEAALAPPEPPADAATEDAPDAGDAADGAVDDASDEPSS